jgi:hypothetical protein
VIRDSDSIMGDLYVSWSDYDKTIERLAARIHASGERNPSIEELKTAVLWRKGCSQFAPDFEAEYLAESPWIHQPFEPYDRMSAEELGERLHERLHEQPGVRPGEWSA